MARDLASDMSSPDMRKLFALEIDPQIDPILSALSARYDQKGEFPKTKDTLDSFLAAVGQRLRDVAEPVGNAIQLEFSVSRSGMS